MTNLDKGVGVFISFSNVDTHALAYYELVYYYITSITWEYEYFPKTKSKISVYNQYHNQQKR